MRMRSTSGPTVRTSSRLKKVPTPRQRHGSPKASRSSDAKLKAAITLCTADGIRTWYTDGTDAPTW